MAQTAKATRENRTITVDFNDETTYFELLSNGRAFYIPPNLVVPP